MKRLALLIACLLGAAGTAAASSITATYSASEQNVGLMKYMNEKYGGSFSFNLGQYVRLDLSYTEDVRLEKGFDEVIDPETAAVAAYEYFESRIKAKSLGANISLILYPGDLLMPYIFAGIAQTIYERKVIIERTGVNSEAGVRSESEGKTDPILSPVGGLGVAIMLSRNFSLKMSCTLRQGTRQFPGEEAEDVYDKSYDVGLTYEFK